MKGAFGRYIDVDLSRGSSRDFEIPASWYETYLGGRGIGLRILLDQLKPDTDPLGPDNILVFATGPLAGIPVLGGSRWQVCGKSPVCSPEHFCYCNMGGNWGVELKFAGCCSPNAGSGVVNSATLSVQHR